MKLARSVCSSPAYGMSASISVSGSIPLCSVPGYSTNGHTDIHIGYYCFTTIFLFYLHKPTVISQTIRETRTLLKLYFVEYFYVVGWVTGAASAQHSQKMTFEGPHLILSNSCSTIFSDPNRFFLWSSPYIVLPFYSLFSFSVL